MQAAYTILAVDDDQKNLDIIRRYLKQDRYVIDTARDGKMGWNKLRNHPGRYDGVLINRVMPRMTGIEFLNKIKTHEKLRFLPVIMQTSHSDRSDIVEGMEAGAYYYLIQPLQEDVLRPLIRAALSDRQRYQEIQSALRFGNTAFQMTQGSFRFRTLEDVHNLSTILAHASQQAERVAIGLSELLLNAVEHGNLEISYEEKTNLLQLGKWQQEIENRLQSEPYSDRYATVSYERGAQSIRITIEDQGKGFEWQKYIEFSPERVFDHHGRGLILARTVSFDDIQYRGRGNIVVARIQTEYP